MGESNENLLRAVRHCQQSLDKYTENRNELKLLHYLQRLNKLPIKVVHLEETGVGRTVNGLRKLGGNVGDSAKGLVAKWKDMVVGEQEEEEEDDDEEDGYQTGEDESDSEEEKKHTSSHRKSDNSRTDDRERKSKHSSRSESHREKSPRKEEKHKRKHSEHTSHKHESDSSSEDETPRKRPKRADGDRHRSRSEDEYKHKSKKSADSDSEQESKSKERKHKSDKYKQEKKKSRESSLERENTHKPSKSKEKQKESCSKDKDKYKSSKKDDSKRHEHSSKPKDAEKKRKDKDKVKNKSEDKREKSSKPKVLNGNLLNEGIGSGSGASFAEALGMCEPSSSKSSSKKKVVEKKEKPSKVDDDVVVPNILKESAVEPPVDLNLSSLLPPITPNYRPLGNLLSSDTQSKKFMSESEALSSIITSKNQRTKVYSGNKTGNNVVPSLFELCIRLLQDHIDALEYTGGVPYNVLKPILEKANPNQLYTMEHHNPYLIEDTDELWALHCQREFRNKERQEMETWRDMYLRCLDERDARLKALTANIKQAQDKSLPVRMTKLAYVDAVAKPPRNIARRQAKNGTAFDVRKPSLTPSAKLSSLATAGEAGKVAVPNPGSRVAERSGHAPKPKKAPLMLKSISSFKNRFKR